MQTTILIVDDDQNLLDFLKDAFTESGYAVVTATNGREALRLARSLVPSLIILDLVLPEKDGFTVCETLRRERRTARIPIVMLTGLTSQLNRMAGFGAGATDYITKPVEIGFLLERVGQMLVQAGSRKGAHPAVRPGPAAKSSRASAQSDGSRE